MKIGRTYQPIPGGGDQVTDEAFDRNVWDADHKHAPSRSAISRMIDGLSVSNNVVVVDAQIGDDVTGKIGNVNRPFRTHEAALATIASGAPALCITMPGTYNINHSFGFPLKDGVDHCLLGATININMGTSSYGSIMVYPYYVKCRVYGKGTFIEGSVNQDWAQITPYVGCDIVFEGMRFEGNKQLIGNQGGVAGEQKNLYFKNCELVANDNYINPRWGAGTFNATGYCNAVFENCYLKGTFLVNSQNPQGKDYLLKFRHCKFEANEMNTNGISASLVVLDYYGNTAVSKTLVDHCSFISSHESIFCGNGYGGTGQNKYLIIYNSRFASGPEGWINNSNPGMKFKLIDNWATVAAGGTDPVVNQLTGVGITVDANLEVE